MNAILSTSGCRARGSPADGPYPARQFTTPFGKPTAWMRRHTAWHDSGVFSELFITTVHPVARAGPSFHACMRRGKFHGMICPTTPTGSWRV